MLDGSDTCRLLVLVAPVVAGKHDDRVAVQSAQEQFTLQPPDVLIPDPTSLIHFPIGIRVH